MKISVLIPAYNEEACIKRVIESVYNANKNVDVLVVNDGSSDKTGEQAKKSGAIVLNNPEKVNEETRKRVLEVIKQLGYRPNAIARGLASRKTTTVGIIVSDITRASVSQMIHGIMTIAKQFSYSIKVFSMNDEPSLDDFVRLVVAEQVDGVIFLNDELDQNQMNQIKKMLDDSNVPFILSNVISEDQNIPAVNIDFETAAYEITKKMIENGRKNIYLFSTVRRYSANNRKEAGYIKAMEEVSGAIVATTLVLLAIFVPVGFLGGITGKIYQQFAVSISLAVTFSSINATAL